jgi:aminomethyltransferase
MLKRTPLFAAHQKAGARLIEFGGWEMPVQYSSIVDEHLAVRKAAGIFDISHMGEFCVSGPSAQHFSIARSRTTFANSPSARANTHSCAIERGGVVDDLYAYRLADDEYLLIVNASRIVRGLGLVAGAIRERRVSGEIRLKNASDEFAPLRFKVRAWPSS